MKLLLKKDLAALGIVGDIIEVQPGFARNYLIPNGLSTEPTTANIKAIAKEREQAEGRRRQAMEALKSRAARLASVEVTIAAAANPEGHLYGSVGPKEIAAALCELGHEVDGSHVRLAEPIKVLDNVLVDVVFAESIEAQVKVWVVRSSGKEDAEGEGEAAEGGAGTDADDDSNA